MTHLCDTRFLLLKADRRCKGSHGSRLICLCAAANQIRKDCSLYSTYEKHRFLSSDSHDHYWYTALGSKKKRRFSYMKSRHGEFHLPIQSSLYARYYSERLAESIPTTINPASTRTWYHCCSVLFRVLILKSRVEAPRSWTVNSRAKSFWNQAAWPFAVRGELSKKEILGANWRSNCECGKLEQSEDSVSTGSSFYVAGLSDC